MKTTQPRFIVTGVPRSGTTFVKCALSRANKAFMTHEINLYGTEFDRNNQYHIRDWLDDVADKLILHQNDKICWVHGCRDNLRLPDTFNATDQEIRHSVSEIKSQAGSYKECVERLETFIFGDNYEFIGDKLPHYSIYLTDITDYIDIDYIVLPLRHPLDIVCSWLKPRNDLDGMSMAKRWINTDSITETTAHIVKFYDSIFEELDKLSQSIVLPIRNSELVDNIEKVQNDFAYFFPINMKEAIEYVKKYSINTRYEKREQLFDKIEDSEVQDGVNRVVTEINRKFRMKDQYLKKLREFQQAKDMTDDRTNNERKKPCEFAKFIKEKPCCGHKWRCLNESCKFYNLVADGKFCRQKCAFRECL